MAAGTVWSLPHSRLFRQIEDARRERVTMRFQAAAHQHGMQKVATVNRNRSGWRSFDRPVSEQFEILRQETNLRWSRDMPADSVNPVDRFQRQHDCREQPGKMNVLLRIVVVAEIATTVVNGCRRTQHHAYPSTH